MKNYPADRTIVILWDHGAGTAGGVCFDKVFDDDSLTLKDIAKALEMVTTDLPETHIDIFGCDACMMATYELAATLSNYPVNYLVASQELEPGCGWNYTPWMKALMNDPSLSNEELCSEIIDSYMEGCLEQTGPDDYLTLSAVRLDAIKPLTEIMEELAGEMAGALQSGSLAAIRRGRSRLYTFGSFMDAGWDQVDMKAALDTWGELAPENVQEAKRLLEDAVILSKAQNVSDANGLTILIPDGMCEEWGDYQPGFSVGGVMTRWLNFMSAYTGLINSSSYSFGAVTPDQVANVETISGSAEGEVTPEYEIQDSEYGFCIQLSETDLQNLDYVEGMLLMALSDNEISGYIDLGTTRENWVDWDSGMVYSLFDGSWPVLGGQPVAMYDQSATEYARRSLIPVMLNGEKTYLVVLFPAGHDEGRILGANAGYDENGLPIRNMTALKEGDRIEPIYTLYYQAADAAEDKDLEETEFTGDPILWQEGMTVTYASLLREEEEEDDEPLNMYFGFVLNDLYGEETLSELVEFEL